jgi:CRISPR-associated protein (TIGR02710 family)
MPADEAQEFYDREVFPRVLDEVVPRERAKMGLSGDEAGYEVMVLPLGTSPEPLIISLAVWRPRRVLLLPTAQSRPLVERVRREAGLSEEQVDVREVLPNDPLPLYTEIRNAYQRWGRPDRGAVDITGGTKVMAAGSGMAASALKFDVVYVWGKERYLEQYRHPEPGTEKVMRIENPLSVLGDLDFQAACAMAERHDYGGARCIMDELARKVPGEGALVYGIWARLGRAYEAWDLLQVGRAAQELEALEAGLDQHWRLPYLARLTSRREQLRAQRAAVVLLAQRLPVQAAALPVADLADAQLMCAVIGTLYQAALRREAAGRLDMAALLWYRLLEVLEQSRLAALGLDTAKPDYAALAKQLGRTLEDLLAAYNVQRQGMDLSPMEALPDPVDLVAGYLLLAAVGQPLVLRLNSLREQTSQRNFSIYAHGYSFVSEKNLRTFRSLAEEVLGRYLTAVGIEAARLEELAFVPWGD